jgi:hypothetical protein
MVGKPSEGASPKDAATSLSNTVPTQYPYLHGEPCTDPCHGQILMSAKTSAIPDVSPVRLTGFSVAVI